MRLAVFQPKDAVVGQKAHRQVGVAALKSGQHRGQPHRNRRKRGHHQLAADLVATPPEAALKLGELVVGGLGHLHQIGPSLGRRIAARVTLEKLGPEARPQARRYGE